MQCLESLESCQITNKLENSDNPFCIDMFLTKRPKCFQSTITMETEISDSHKMVIAVLRIFYEKQKAKIVYYRIYKILNIDTNKAELINFTDTVLSVHCDR